ncbi:hypothetical protein GUJ93_ZPchr0008g12135 [Zizania palustris]|uniref:Uncharacterized protein n=1 Tax=Zizania palustris TaxID=103762 RepID=A0A8J5RUH5_ZIZPA|nr:hypothetical protein GUJ93_ZPchr0008g12135 [Zizania palustris]
MHDNYRSQLSTKANNWLVPDNEETAARLVIYDEVGGRVIGVSEEAGDVGGAGGRDAMRVTRGSAARGRGQRAPTWGLATAADTGQDDPTAAAASRLRCYTLTTIVFAEQVRNVFLVPVEETMLIRHCSRQTTEAQVEDINADIRQCSRQVTKAQVEEVLLTTEAEKCANLEQNKIS